MRSLFSLALLALCFFVPAFGHSAITITATGTYDSSSNGNTWDRSATTDGVNTISASSFIFRLNTYFAQGMAGVIDFDSPTGSSVEPTSTDFLTVNYGLTNNKQLKIQNVGAGNLIISSAVTNRTPISGANYLGKTSATNGDQFNFSFSALDRITAIGATILSREGSGGSVSATVQFSDTTTANVTITQGGTQATDDLFFGFQTTLAQQTSGVYITGLTFDPNDYRGLDDLAFIMAPEPSRALLFALGGIFLLGRRRR